MKYSYKTLLFFSFLSHFMVAMDAPVNNIWKLSEKFENHRNLKSAYFDKQGQLLVCTDDDIFQIDPQTLSFISVSRRTCKYDSFSSAKNLNLNLENTKNFTSAYAIRNGQFLIWATADETKKKGITTADHLITFENNAAERKLESVHFGGQVMPAFDRQCRPNYLIFGSKQLSPTHFDSQEELFAIFNDNKMGICKIDPNEDLSRAYIAQFGYKDPVKALCFHPIKKIIAVLTTNSLGKKSRISVIDGETQKELFSVLLKKIAHSINFDHNNRLAAACGDSIEIIFLDQEKVKRRISIPNNKDYRSMLFQSTRK